MYMCVPVPCDQRRAAVAPRVACRALRDVYSDVCCLLHTARCMLHLMHAGRYRAINAGQLQLHYVYRRKWEKRSTLHKVDIHVEVTHPK